MTKIELGKHISPVSANLDMIRGIAALFVAASHIRVLFLCDFPKVVNKNIFVKAIYLFTGLGHQAVMVFFVLSGYFISSSVIRTLRANQWNWSTYAVHRLTRLYVVLIPALILGLILDKTGLMLHGFDSIYVGLPAYKNILTEPAIRSLNVESFFGNLFYLQKIVVHPFGSNTPLWSLSYEFWYYVLFPIVAMALWPITPMPQRVLFSIVIIALLCFVGRDISIYFLIWLMGTAVAMAPSRPTSIQPLLLYGSASAFVASLLISRLTANANEDVQSFLIGLTFSIFLYGVINKKYTEQAVLYKTAARHLSGMSYTLYLVHFPFLIFLSAAIIGTHALWQPDALGLGKIVIIGIFTLLYAFVIAYFTESRTASIRNAILKWTSQTSH